MGECSTAGEVVGDRSTRGDLELTVLAGQCRSAKTSSFRIAEQLAAPQGHRYMPSPAKREATARVYLRKWGR
jgi:hypothetical protein